MPINEEYIFTYKDYLAITQPDGLLCVAEGSVEYLPDEMDEMDGMDEIDIQQEEIESSVCDKRLGIKEVHQKHDKSFKDVLSDKKEMAFFLREFVGIDVNENELQHYKSEFITKQYNKREADVVYKNTEQDVYYIVEHQSKKDRSMPYRMTEYCIELMKDVISDTNCKVYPTIVPIVLYTGEGKWNVETNFAERQKFSRGSYIEYTIDIKYTVVDINKIKDMDLLEKQDYLANVMLLEKYKVTETRMEMLKNICNGMKSEKKIEQIINYAISVYGQTLDSETLEGFYKMFERRGKNMTAMYEYIIRERKANMRKWKKEGLAAGRKEGRREGRKEGIEKGIKEGIEKGIKEGIKEGKNAGILENLVATIKNMLKYNVDDETIMKYTDARQEDIDRVREELKMQTAEG